MLGMVLSLLAVVLFGFAIWKKADITPGATPIISVTGLVCVVIFFSMVGMLKVGVFFSYALALLAFVLAVLDDNGKKIQGYFTPSVVIFLGFSCLLLIILKTNSPMMSQWDEFSFWGTAAKLIKERGALYTYYKSSMIGSSMPPALPVLTYYFGWGFEQFCEWARFFAYDVMFIASYCAVISVFDRKNQWISAPVFATIFMLPYFFGNLGYTTGLAVMYVTVYSEVPLALLFTSVLAVYFSARSNDGRDILITLPVICFLTFAKDMGLALSCIALFIIFFDLLVAKEHFVFFKIGGFVGKILSAVTMLATTGASYVLWAVHMSRVMERNPLELGGETNMSAVGLLLTGVKELLGLMPRSEKFSTVTKLMINAFFSTRISMLGAGVRIFAVIFILFATAFLLSRAEDKLKVATMYITSLIGFVGYYVFHLFLYVYIFKDNAYTLTSYNRYVYPYYMGWLILALIALAIVANSGKIKFSVPVILGFGACIIALCAVYIRPENTFVAINPDTYAKRGAVKMQADYLRDVITSDDVIFVLSDGDAGESWFIYTYEFTDNIIYQEPDIPLSEGTPQEKSRQYAQGLAKFMKDRGVTHFMMDYPSDRILEYIGDLFDVRPGQFGLGSVGYYRVEYTDTGFNCELIKGTGIN